MQKFKIVLYKVYKFADLNNFLNFPQLILLCVYFKFHGKDTGIGLIGAERCWKLPILAGIWTPNLEKDQKHEEKHFLPQVRLELTTPESKKEASTTELRRIII